MKINYKTSRNTIKKIVDENTIKEITTAKLLDLPFKKLNPDEDKRWNARKINAELLQAIEQGEDIKTMSERFLKIKGMNETSAMRNARTMTTSFENLGRLDGMKKMQENGTILKKKWLATNDSKTRDAHAQLNGTVAEVDEPFRNDLGEIMYPGDPSASPANIWNCRCTLIYEIEGFEPTLPKGTITVGEDASEIAWTPNFDDYDTNTLRDCMLKFGKKITEIERMSGNEMKKVLENEYKKAAEKITDLRAKYTLPKENPQKISEWLKNIPDELIPDTVNSPSNFQRYTLLKLHGDLPDVVDDLSGLDGVPIYRGLKNAEITANTIGDITRYDPNGYVGDGMYGDGTYFTTSKEHSLRYGSDKIIEAKLKPTAKIIDDEDLRQKRKQQGFLPIICDTSVWAVENGYDVIRKKHNNGEIFYNILRRSCLWIKK